MSTYKPSTLPNTRIDVADILRAIAIAGIVLIHFLEHMNYYDFPVPDDPFWKSVGDAIWATVPFLLGGKMYAIFSVLFGLSFYIQHDNQAQRGVDFRPRFLWRLTLLMLFGFIDLAFYNGDILTIYAVCGLLVLPFIRANDKVLLGLTLFFLLQPVELIYMVLGLFNPDLAPFSLGSGYYYRALEPVQNSGSFWEMAWAGIKYGFPVNFIWTAESGRLTLNICFFFLGIWLGRKRLFYNEGKNLLFWQKVCIGSIVAFAILCPAYFCLPALIDLPAVSRSLHTALNMWKNFAMMSFYVSGIVLLFYKTRYASSLMKLAPYGKMSLTNYLAQSVIGAFLFYHWGVGLYAHCYHTSSLLIGIVLVLFQWRFSCYWMKHHKRGPLEGLWNKLTWIGRK